MVVPATDQPGVYRLPVLPLGHWDHLVKRFRPKHETLPYPEKKLFNGLTGRLEEVPERTGEDRRISRYVDEDVDLNEGVMSQTQAIFTLL